ncbi:hypothetical protein M438DRAFT_344728, partial [Aureobasidium pullulans EXF-150]
MGRVRKKSVLYLLLHISTEGSGSFVMQHNHLCKSSRRLGPISLVKACRSRHILLLSDCNGPIYNSTGIFCRQYTVARDLDNVWTLMCIIRCSMSI